MWKPSKAKQQRETEDKQKSQGMRDSDRLNGKKWADLNRRTSAMTAANPNKKRRWRQLHSWMIIITVVALSSSLFAYHEFSRGGSTFRQTWIQHPLYPNQTNQPASQPAAYTSPNLCCVNNRNLCSFVANSFRELNFCSKSFTTFYSCAYRTLTHTHTDAVTLIRASTHIRGMWYTIT